MTAFLERFYPHRKYVKKGCFGEFARNTSLGTSSGGENKDTNPMGLPIAGTDSLANEGCLIV